MASVGPLLCWVGGVGQYVDGTLVQRPPERERGGDLEHRLRVLGREQASGEAVAQFGYSVSC
jgi:hypothetical protein